jgi:hypothetical protein
MYYTGLDPRTMKEVYVPKNPHEKELQRALLQWKRPEKRRLVMEALHKAGREDLIGYGPDCLLRPIRPVKVDSPEKKGVKVDKKSGKAAPKTAQKGKGDRKAPTRQGKAPGKKKR